MPFTFKNLEIPGLVLINPKVFYDERGFFTETYKITDFTFFGIMDNFVQENHSRSTQGVLRGLHFQNPPFSQGKLVRAVRGDIFDVAVDIRKGSATFGRWAGVTLSEDNKNMLYIPPGFAHGFCVTSPVADVIYLTTSVYSADAEAGIIYNDAELNIQWPSTNPIVSEKDLKWPSFRNANNKFTI